MKLARRSVLLVLGSIAGATGGCSGGGGPTSAEALITPAGGELVLGDLHLTVPRGALDVAVKLRAERLPPAGDGPSRAEILGAIYELSPDGLVFHVPAVLTFAHVTAPLGSGDGNDGVAVAWWDVAAGQWTAVPTWSSGGTSAISAEIGHFTPWGVRRPTEPTSGCANCETSVGGACVPLTCADPCSSCDAASGLCVRAPVGDEPSTSGSANCGGNRCFNLATDAANCGACGNRCPAAAACSAGQCTCPSGQTYCEGGPLSLHQEGICTDLQSDTEHCGSCFTGCPTAKSQVCVEGACTCGAGRTFCVFEGPSGGGDDCVLLQSDAENCGSCNHKCPAGSACVGGTCGMCTAGDTSKCPGSCDVCVDGQCQSSCKGCTTCSQGQCVAQCPSCQTCAGDTCVPAKCGPCETCFANACVSSCGQSEGCCAGACTSTTTEADCGGCGIICGAGEVCRDGACQDTAHPRWKGFVDDTTMGTSGPTLTGGSVPNEEGSSRIHTEVTWDWSTVDSVYRPSGTVVYELSHKVLDGPSACTQTVAPFTLTLTRTDGSLSIAAPGVAGAAQIVMGWGLLHAFVDIPQTSNCVGDDPTVLHTSVEWWSSWRGRDGPKGPDLTNPAGDTIDGLYDFAAQPTVAESNNSNKRTLTWHFEKMP